MSDRLILPVEVAGIAFKNPFFVASGPTTRTVEQLVAIERAGWAAASLKLSVEPAPYISRYPRYALLPEYNALGFTAEKRLTYDQGRRLMEAGKKSVKDLILLANITYSGDLGVDGWVEMALGFEASGADLIELNMCCPNMSFNVQTTAGDKEAIAQNTGASMGQSGEAVAEVVRAIKAKLQIPLVVKLTPEGGGIGRVAHAAYLAGADAVSGTANRLGMPPIDLENPGCSTIHLQDEVGMACMCGAWLKPLAQRDTFEMRRICGPDMPIFATGGIRTAEDALQMAMCGGDLIGICTETLISGYNFIGDVIADTKAWLHAHGHTSLRDIRDQMIPAVKSAPELTLYRGYAEVAKPDLIASCMAVCPKSVEIQAVLRRVAEGDMTRAMELAAGSEHCMDCPAPCETACVRGRADKAVSIRSIMLELRAHADQAGMEIAMRPDGRLVGRPVVKAADVLAGRQVDGLGVAADGLQAAALRCLRCGCGEGCGVCADLCCEFAIGYDEANQISIDPKRCVACGICYNRCPDRNIRIFNTGERL